MKSVTAYVLKLFLSVAVVFLLAACTDSDSASDSVAEDGTGDTGSGTDDSGGGGGGTVSDVPAAPVVTAAYDDWTITLEWPEVAEATYYQVFEDPTGSDGFSQIGGDLTGPGYTNNVSLTERDGARYIVAACNNEGCTESAEITLTGLDSGFSPVVVSGDPAPGMGGAVFSGEVGTQLTFDVNQAGTIAVLGATDQTDSSGSLRDGIFRQTEGGTLTLVQADDATLPDSDATYNGFFNVKISLAGQILFGGILNRTLPSEATDDVDGLNNEVLLRNVSSTTELVAREGDPDRNGTLFPTLDAGDVYFTENVTTNRLFANLSVDGSGGVTFQPGSNTDAFVNSDDSTYFGANSLWTITGADVFQQSLRASETSLPNNLEPGFFGFLPFSQNPAGQLAFGLSLLNADGSPISDTANSGVYVRNTNGTFTEAVRESGGAIRDNIDDLNSATVKMTDNGEVFYLASRDVAGDGNQGLYTSSVDGNDFVRVARKAQPFLLQDGSVQDITDFIGGGSAFDPGDDDAVAFLVNAGAVSDQDALIVWTNNGTSGSAQRVFQEGDTVRGLLDASGVDLDVPSASPAPRLRFGRDYWAAFQADDESGTNPRRLLLASSPSGYTRLIAREGQWFALNGTRYGVVTEILDFAMASPAELVVSLRFDEDGVFGLQPGGSFVDPDGKNGIFRVVLCSPSEPC